MDEHIAGRVIRFDPDCQSIAEFLAQWTPSSIAVEHVEWLTVSTKVADKTQVHVDSEGLLVAWQSLCLSSRVRLTTADIEALAIVHNVVNGKWMIFMESAQVDSQWEKVATAVVKDGLAHEAKVSTLQIKTLKSGLPKEEKIPNGKHVICVWSDNFVDTSDVFNLRRRLEGLGFSNRLHYKPDAYSICGVYQAHKRADPLAFNCSV